MLLRLLCVEAFRIASPGDSLVTEVTSALGTIVRPLYIVLQYLYSFQLEFGFQGLILLHEFNYIPDAHSFFVDVFKRSLAFRKADVPASMCWPSWQSLRVPAHHLSRLTGKFGFVQPTAVQRAALDALMPRSPSEEATRGPPARHAVIRWPTGSGKTVAFALPLLARFDHTLRGSGAQALVMTPTRELALQTLKVLKRMAEHGKSNKKGHTIKVQSILGQSTPKLENELHYNPPDVVVGTPYAVSKLLNQGLLRLAPTDNRTLVLDEVGLLTTPRVWQDMRNVLFNFEEAARADAGRPSVFANPGKQKVKMARQPSPRWPKGSVWIVSAHVPPGAVEQCLSALYGVDLGEAPTEAILRGRHRREQPPAIGLPVAKSKDSSSAVALSRVPKVVPEVVVLAPESGEMLPSTLRHVVVPLFSAGGVAVPTRGPPTESVLIAAMLKEGRGAKRYEPEWMDTVGAEASGEGGAEAGAEGGTVDGTGAAAGAENEGAAAMAVDGIIADQMDVSPVAESRGAVYEDDHEGIPFDEGGGEGAASRMTRADGAVDGAAVGGYGGGGGGGGGGGRGLPPMSAEMNDKLDAWVAAKRERDFETSDRLRAEMKDAGVNPEEYRPAPGDASARASLDGTAKGMLVFVPSSYKADELCRTLRNRRIAAAGVHSRDGNSARDPRITGHQKRGQALKDFAAGKLRVLLSTDMLAQGVDIRGATHVINTSVPEDAPSYLHRAGRVGRTGGAPGTVVSLARNEADLARLQQYAAELDFELEVVGAPKPVPRPRAVQMAKRQHALAAWQQQQQQREHT